MSSAIPIRSPNDQNNIPMQFSRNSFAHTPGMGGISWGGASVGSWLRDEVLMASKTKDLHGQDPLFTQDHAEGMLDEAGASSASSSSGASNEDSSGSGGVASNRSDSGHDSGGGSGGTGTGGALAGSVGDLHNSGAPHDLHDPLLDLAPTYFPSLEANFCRDYSCCGRLLPTLHDLLRHYEEQHISPSPPEEPPVMRRMQNIETVSTNDVFMPFERVAEPLKDDDAMALGGLDDIHAGIAGVPGIDDMDLDLAGPGGATGGPGGIHGGGAPNGGIDDHAGGSAGAGAGASGGASGTTSGGHGGAAGHPRGAATMRAGESAFAPPSFQPLTASTLNQYGTASHMKASGVNPLMRGVHGGGAQSARGGMGGVLGPLDGGSDHHLLQGLHGSGAGGASQSGLHGSTNTNGFGGFAYGGLSAHGVPGVFGSGVSGVDGRGTAPPHAPGSIAFGDDEEPTIDDPARQLYMLERSENKPFKCPVIGCEKTYKNQNGLKYHRQHGHQNQTLHLNEDGTYSIIDPLSNTPYPDGMGMEKDKPYRCEVCGKRYKNLNGLKYHRAHSTH